MAVRRVWLGRAVQKAYLWFYSVHGMAKNNYRMTLCGRSPSFQHMHVQGREASLLPPTMHRKFSGNQGSLRVHYQLVLWCRCQAVE